VSDGPARAGGLALLAASCFALLSPLSVLVTRGGTPLVTAMTWRFALGGVVLLGLAWREGGGRIVWPSRAARWRLVLVGGLGQLVITWLSLASLRWLPAPTQVFLFYTYPAWITVLQAARGVERLDGRRVAALLLAAAGIAGVVDPGALLTGSAAAPGIALVLSAALCYAMYVPLLGWLQREGGPTLTSALITLSAAGWFALASVLTEGRLVPATDPGSLLALLGLGLLCTALAFWAFLRALAGLGPVRTAILSTAEPLVGTGIAALLLGQRVGPSALLGGAAIVGAVILLVRAPRRPAVTLPAPS
jgi:drug/metabolite transporter (DMT)-like permease